MDSSGLELKNKWLSFKGAAFVNEQLTISH